MDLASYFEKHPEWDIIKSIIQKIKAAGFIAYLAGGCVRDALRGQTAQDFDIATSATPDQILSIFPKALTVGKAFGVIIIPFETFQVEVASFRKDGLYIDGRHPQNVDFASPQEDAQRRDFTVNAIFYDPLEGKIHDFVEGQKDLKNKILKTVGVAADRFQEDHLRLIRAIRFAAQLDFKIEESTWDAILTLHTLIKDVSKERIRDELVKVFKTNNPHLGLTLLYQAGFTKVLFPELEATFEEIRARFENKKNLIDVLGLCLLLRDTPSVKTILTEWRFSTKVINDVGHILEAWHRLSDSKPLREALLKRLLIEDWSPLFLTVVDELKEKGPQHRQALKLGVLKKPKPYLNGEDLKKLGFSPSPKMGHILEELLNLQLEEKIKNHQDAITWVKNQS